MTIAAPRCSAVFAAAFLAVCCASCTYATGQAWQRNECGRIADANEYQRCLERARGGEDEYRRDAERARGAR